VTTWHFDQRQIPGKRSSELTLSWRLNGSSITDDYTAEDITAAELWSIWRERYGQEDQQPIYWNVHGDGISEFAPFVPHATGSENFLTYYTWPVDDEGIRLRWFDLSIEDKAWNREAIENGADFNGGFIQEHTGWKPSALQLTVDLAFIERVLSGEAV
jgi:hypothetical protein